MEKFEKASRLKLRFNSNKGLLISEDLWDLPLTQLNSIAKTLNKELATMEEEDFLEEAVKEDVEVRLGFEIVLHVLKTKKEEAQKRRDATGVKAEKDKLLEIIAKKQDEGLENLSEEELKKKLAELG